MSASTSVKLDAELKHRIERLAEDQQRSPHWLMKKAIAEFADREEASAQFRRDAEDASEHYKRSGLHLTHEEVSAWLDRVADGEDIEAPECHT